MMAKKALAVLSCAAQAATAHTGDCSSFNNETAGQAKQ